jgi:hypothetical protein
MSETLPFVPAMVVRVTKGMLEGQRGVIIDVKGDLCHVLLGGVLLAYLKRELEVM